MGTLTPSAPGAASWRTETWYRQAATHGLENERPFEYMTADDAEDRDRHDRRGDALAAAGALAAPSDSTGSRNGTGSRNSDAGSDGSQRGGGGLP